MKRKWFTLPELILVVAVSLCVAVLFIAAVPNNPVAVCADNLRKLAQAATAYAADNAGALPGTTAKTGDNWQLRIAPYLGYAKPGPGWAPNDYPIFKCPSDQVEPDPWLRQNRHIMKMSYCANATLIDLDDRDSNLDKHQGGRKLDEVPTPGGVILFAEYHGSGNAMRHGPAIKCYNPGFTYEYSRQNGTLENDNAKVGYHNFKNNYAMLDGSVHLLIFDETLKPVNKWIIK